MFSVLRRRRRAAEISVGARYCRRDTPNLIWEVYSLFTGTDGMSYAGIFSSRIRPGARPSRDPSWSMTGNTPG